MKRRTIFVAIAGLLLFMPMQAIEANEAGSATAEVSYVVDENSRYVLTVDTGVGGTIFDGTQRIRDSTMIYELKIGTQKKFEILPDEGWKVADITYERPQMKDSRSLLPEYQREGSITIQAETTEMHLRVSFEKQKPVAETKPESNAQRPNTGIDMRSAQLYMMLIASAGIILLYKRHRHRNKQ